MINLIRAEWKKLLGNRMLASFTVWLYPVGLAALIFVLAIIYLLGGETYQEMTGAWDEQMLSTWGIITRFPDASFGRMPLLAFMAVMCAGEYEWGTWKNIIPRNDRWTILVAKILTMAFVLVFAVGLTSIISGPIRYGVANLVGIEPAGGPTSAEFSSFAGAYALETGIAFILSLFLACFALFAALLTRTIVGSLLLSFGISMLEMLSPILMVLLSRVSNRPEIINGYALAPSYLVDNLRSWILYGTYVETGFADFTWNLSATSSALLLTALLIGSAGLCLGIFHRQDITS